MSSPVEQIKAKIDIVTLISSYMKLEKAGQNFKGKCPFHNEKTPSFFVSPDRGNYYCFGCQAKGDIFTFVEEFEGLDFVGALKVLAERAGVQLQEYKKEEKTEMDRLLEVMEQAVFFYQKKLSENKQALDYLHSRGITDETIKNFRIGFAPDEWRSVSDFLFGKGALEADLFSVGLVKRPEGSKDKIYDTFRGRIMFPINDSSGRPVGFSGRILVAGDPSNGSISSPQIKSGQANAPKYLNSPETQLFNKSEILFGLDKAKREIRLKDYSILVEGQMDLVMLHQIGLSNTVASSGTALTTDHLVKLRRISSRLIMSFDGDSAGFNASDRSAKLALSLGFELKVAQMPLGKDPADLAKEDPNQLKTLIGNSKHIVDFYVDSLMSRDVPGRELGQEIIKHVLPYVSELPTSVERAHFIKSIAQKTFIKEDALWDDLKNAPNIAKMTNDKDSDNIQNIGTELDRADFIVRKLVGILLWKKSRPEVMAVDEVMIEQKLQMVTGMSIDQIFDKFEKEKDNIIFDIERSYDGHDSLAKDTSYLLIGLEGEFLKKKYEKTMELLQKAERERNSTDIMKYLEECQRISQEINNIKIKNK